MNKNPTKVAPQNKYEIELTCASEYSFENQDSDNEDFDGSNNDEYYQYIANSNVVNNDYKAKPYRNKVYFNFSGLDFLLTEEPTANKGDNIYICAYHVNSTGKLPFLTFALKKYPEHFFEDMLTFPCFSYISDSSLMDESELKMKEFLGLYKDKNQHTYKGFFAETNNVYLFYDISDYDLQIQELYRRDPMWMVMVDEIINHKQVCNFPIHSQVTNFFSTNTQFTKLQDENGCFIEQPIVCYNGVHESILNFTSIFGTPKMENDGIAGPYYYFTSYQNAIEAGAWSKYRKTEFRYGKKITETDSGKYDKGGIVRFALFTGSMKVPLNYPEDEVDTSLMKKQLLEDGIEHERHIMRISDYDGVWANDYDSIYIGKLELDNGQKIVNAPYWVVKEYEQQLPVSFHHIDKRTIGEVWDENVKHYIK